MISLKALATITSSDLISFPRTTRSPESAQAQSPCCMNPLDFLKVKFQLSTRGPESGVGRDIWQALRDVHASEGWHRLYCGLGPNVVAIATSWALYFLFAWIFNAAGGYGASLHDRSSYWWHLIPTPTFCHA